MIAKSLSTSQRYARLHGVAGKRAEFCQAIYPLLLAHADDFGRLAGDVFTVKHAIVPTSPRSEADIERALDALHEVNLIVWYEVEGRKCIQIQDFDAHQQGLHKRTRSTFPEPSGIFREIPSEGKGTEQKGKELKKSVSPEPEGSVPFTPTFLEFPTVGIGGTAYQLSESQVLEWAGLFATIDVQVELRKALAWILAHKARRKTASGMPRFLVGWLTRATNSGRAHEAPAATKERQPWTCLHVERCHNRAMCRDATALGRPEREQVPA